MEIALKGTTDMRKRLMLLGITSQSQMRIRHFNPVLVTNIDKIIRRFYEHILSFPEAASLLTKVDIKGRLIPAQREHWLQLFKCEFSDEFVNRALRIGRIHYTNRIPPYLYMGGYNYFLCAVLEMAAQHVRGLDLPELLADITRLVTLDMDLSISAYLREHWRDGEGDAVAAP